MADREYWIQIENRPWDACPNDIDRVHGAIDPAFKDDPNNPDAEVIPANIEHVEGVPPITVTLTSPETNVTKERRMYLPVNKGKGPENGPPEWQVIDALILRRYTENWQTPDDRKVNPWDLNEPDPTDNGTMGTIPGPTLECNVGDKIIVHLRNKDFRTDTDITARTHSLHPHGIVFNPESDGAFPLSPADKTQEIPDDEKQAWRDIKVKGDLKQGDRVPPGGTFTYTWDTLNWPTTAGVWHYHDHSICDHINVGLGLVGFLVIHNPEDPDDVIEQDLPQGQPNGQLTRLRSVPLDPPVPLLPHHLEGLRRVIPEERDEQAERDEAEHGITSDFALESGPFVLEVDQDLQTILSSSQRVYIDPPRRLQILQYYHELPGTHMTINGRTFLGNTPTVIAGTETQMRFGLVGMNSDAFHTFHLHGHRWVIPGPQGTDPGTIQGSPQVQAVSQFEDTRLFGPANSFHFTINQGSFMGSRFTPDPSRARGKGEWHMHCHVLNHMMHMGMMGSLLVIDGGEWADPLPFGRHCETHKEEAPPKTILVGPQEAPFTFKPDVLKVSSGDTVTFDFRTGGHNVIVSPGGVFGDALASPPLQIFGPGGPGTAVAQGKAVSIIITGSSGSRIEYECGFHGEFGGMKGTIVI